MTHVDRVDDQALGKQPLTLKKALANLAIRRRSYVPGTAGRFQDRKKDRGAQHLEYIEAMIEMHAQMVSPNTLVGVLGYIPKVSVN